jgi:hypothetical protein
MFFLIDPAKPLSQDSPKFFKNESTPISDVDLDGLEKGKLFALCLDKKKQCSEFMIILIMLHQVLTENQIVNTLVDILI